MGMTMLFSSYAKPFSVPPCGPPVVHVEPNPREGRSFSFRLYTAVHMQAAVRSALQAAYVKDKLLNAPFVPSFFEENKM